MAGPCTTSVRLSAEGGREKFALAMTRARRSLHVLTCFRPEDLDHTRLSYGAVDFYELLNREIAGNTDLGTPASRAAASEQALGADPLVADLGDRLRARGARVWHQYDGVIDVVAAADPLSTMGQDDAEIPWPVAIESDGTEQYRTMSVRERSRLRPQLLERMGWRYMPLWTIEVFTDPSACADRIAGYLGLEKWSCRAGPRHPPISSTRTWTRSHSKPMGASAGSLTFPAGLTTRSRYSLLHRKLPGPGGTSGRGGGGPRGPDTERRRQAGRSR